MWINASREGAGEEPCRYCAGCPQLSCVDLRLDRTAGADGRCRVLWTMSEFLRVTDVPLLDAAVSYLSFARFMNPVAVSIFPPGPNTNTFVPLPRSTPSGPTITNSASTVP